MEPELPRDQEENPMRPSRSPCHRECQPNPCPGCGEDKLLHFREFCPNRNKMCYNCGRSGQVQEVCRTTTSFQSHPRRPAHPRADSRTHDVKWDRKYSPTRSEFKNMNQHPYLPIRSLSEPGTPAEQHRKWINDEPCRETEVTAEKKRWTNHFKQSKKIPAQFQDLDDESRKRSVWWHAFLIETGNIELDETSYG